MATTQQHIPVSEILDDIFILKDGTYGVILQTSAVNFDLLSENEQLAIISSFAGMLNSLSFPIQLVIRSKRLDISSYINLLVKAEGFQTNPLLKQMMERYRVFVETIIRENEVLDKQFFVVLTISSLELGVGIKPDQKVQKALTQLMPRMDHIIRQLGRIGLSSQQLTTDKLIKLFYDIYNEQALATPAEQTLSAQPITQNGSVQAAPPRTITPIPTSQPPLPIQPIAPPPQSLTPTATPSAYPPRTSRPASPFVVEELPDDYGTI